MSVFLQKVFVKKNKTKDVGIFFSFHAHEITCGWWGGSCEYDSRGSLTRWHA